MAQVGNGMPELNPPIGPDGLVGMHPPRIDHIFLMCETSTAPPTSSATCSTSG